MANMKSDVAAKNAFVCKLNESGYNARITGSPADVTATRDGVTWYFEIKMTRHKDRYFGAATLTEWRQAFKDPEHFKFVVAIADDSDLNFQFIEYTTQEFMEYSTIPPFKIFFNIDFSGRIRRRSGGDKSAICMSQENFELLDECFGKLKSGKWKRTNPAI